MQIGQALLRMYRLHMECTIQDQASLFEENMSLQFKHANTNRDEKIAMQDTNEVQFRAVEGQQIGIPMGHNVQPD